MTIQGVLGDKLETSVKSCGQRTRSLVRDSCGRQVGDKREIMRTKAHPEWETSGKQVGDKPEIMRAENPGCSEGAGRQVRNHADQSTQRIQGVFCRKTSPETNAKSRGPSMHPFQRSKNPSQINLFGEKLTRHNYIPFAIPPTCRPCSAAQ